MGYRRLPKSTGPAPGVSTPRTVHARASLLLLYWSFTIGAVAYAKAQIYVVKSFRSVIAAFDAFMRFRPATEADGIIACVTFFILIAKLFMLNDSDTVSHRAEDLSLILSHFQFQDPLAVLLKNVTLKDLFYLLSSQRPSALGTAEFPHISLFFNNKVKVLFKTVSTEEVVTLVYEVERLLDISKFKADRTLKVAFCPLDISFIQLGSYFVLRPSVTFFDQI
jgi:hypothetical protein